MNVRIDYEQLQRGASQLKTGQQEVVDQLTRLKGMIDSLVGSAFVTDVASGKFHESYTQWNTGATNVINGLEGMSTFLQTVLAQHQQLDSQLGQAAS
jgi:WXG100 family type VII secretion target